MSKLIVGINDLATIYPNIATEWHPTLNGNLHPNEVFSSSSKMVWWVCDKGHSYQQTIQNRTLKHFGCSYCSGHRVLKGFNDLASVRPDVAKEWCYEKNEGKTPYDFTAGSGKKVWWTCPLGHDYVASIHERTGHNTGCPKCDKRRQSSFPEQAVLYYVKKIFPDTLSKYKVIFSKSMELDVFIPSIKVGIEFDGKAWHNDDIIHNREIRKYAVCKKHGIKLIRIKEYNKEDWQDVADIVYRINKFRKYKELEDVIRNILDNLDPSSNMWTRKNPFHFHSDVDINITRDRGEILNYLNRIDNSLEETRPDVVKMWDWSKNKNLHPNMFTISSNQVVFWKCPDCNHEWECSINSMTRKGRCGCSECSKKRRGRTFTKGVVSKVGSLLETHPYIAKDWHPTKNGDLNPNDITAGKFKKVWWLCSKCGLEWEASPNNRKKGVGCPHCSGRVAQSGLDDIVTLFPDVLSYWDYERNRDIDPTKILPGSGQKAAWKCVACKHEWTQIIHRRIKSPVFCPKCKNRKPI